MAFADWRGSFSVANAEMDGHHQTLFQIINHLHEAILAHQGREELGVCIQELLEYTRRHFAAEERLMRACGYSAYEGHKREHERLLAQVMAMEAAYRDPNHEDGDAVPKAFAFLLKDWLMNHILVMDKAYAPYIAPGDATLLEGAVSHHPQDEDPPAQGGPQ